MDLGRLFKPKTGDTPTQKPSSPNKPCASPILNQVMSVTRGATEAFSGVTSHVNTSLRKKLGAKNMEAGVGFGHGLAVKPGVLSQIQSSLVVGVTKMMMKFGMMPSLPFDKGALQASLQSGISTVDNIKNQVSPGSMMQLAAKQADQVTQGLAGSQLTQIGSAFKNTAFKENAVDSKLGSQTEKVQNPLLNGEEGGPEEAAGRVQSDNNILQMVLKHQRIIEELVEENEKLRQILVEDLKIPSSKLEASSADRNEPNSKGENDRRNE